MKASYRWLKELVPGLTADAAEVSLRLTGAGLEVEGQHEYGQATEVCLVARVESIRPHPTKSGLRLVTVDRGGAKQEVVCGAPNVPDPGGLVVLAPLGAHLPAKNMTIGKRAVAGVESEGMLCSESELGLGDDHDGIMILAPGTGQPGQTLASVIPNARDTVYEINLGANRPDGLGHIGLAREVAAAFDLPFTPLAPKVSASDTTEVTIRVEDAERCPHYGAASVTGISIGKSPIEVRYRLQALGVRSISNVVDVTNIVMLESGHPMHAFDWDRVRGNAIVVRRAKNGEAMTTLDGVERKLVDDDLLICDGEGPTALAGVMGGADSEIQNDTKRVLFECAWFDPRGVRRTARRHAMHTESSHRFERGVDPGDVVRVLDRAVELTLAWAGGKAGKRVHVQGARVASEPTAVERRSVPLRAHRIEEVLGLEIPWAQAVKTLEKLGCEVSGDLVKVPTHRPDLGREIDLIEEVMRTHGIDHIPAVLPAIRASRDVGGREELARRARNVATGLGLSEAITYGFTNRTTLAALSAPEPTVLIANPMGEHNSVMRTTLLPGLLEAVKNARRHGERDVREFTVGPVFLPGGDDGLPREELRMAFVIAGDRAAWLSKPQTADVWDAKGYAIGLVEGLSRAKVDVKVARTEIAHLHPRGAAWLEANGTRIGSFGPLHPDAVEKLELDGEVLVGEFTIEPFTQGRPDPKFVNIPRFPAATRDIALIVKDGTPAGEVERAVREAAGALAEDVRLFDRFVGGQVAAGSSSLAFRVVYRSPDRTLNDAEVDAAHANVVKTVNDRFGATLRQ